MRALLSVLLVFVAACGGEGSSPSESAKPSIVSITPAEGSAGDEVVVEGVGFGLPGKLTLAEEPMNAKSWTPTKIEFTIGENWAPGAVSLSITTKEGAIVKGKFKVLPRVDRYEPARPISGSPIELYGVNFGDSSVYDGVYLGNVRLDVEAWRANVIVATIPESTSAGEYDGVVSVRGADSDAFQVTITPYVAGVIPNGNQILQIVGLGFGTSEGTVTVGGIEALTTSWEPKSITAFIPSQVPAGYQPVVVEKGGQSSDAVSLLVVPEIDSATPVTNAIATQLQLTGANFGSSQGFSSVEIDGSTASVVSWSSSEVTVKLSDALEPGIHFVALTANSIDAIGASFEISPSIRQVTPEPLVSGVAVTIQGAFFGSAFAPIVKIGTTALSLQTSSATQLVTTTLATTVPPGTHTLSVEVGAYKGQKSVNVRPTIASLSQPQRSGGDSLTVTGSNFGTASGSAQVGGVNATVTSWGNTSVVFTVPAGVAAGTRDVTVTAAGQISNAKTLTVNPKVTGVSPRSGICGGNLGIAGTNFGAVPGSVTIDSVAATLVSWSNDVVVVDASALVSGAHTVAVTAGGISSTSVTITCPPIITSASVESGRGGDPVTVNGTDFGTTQGSVTVGGVSASISAWSNTAVTFTLPRSVVAGNWNITLVSGNVPSNVVPVTVLPKIDFLEPARAAPGATVTVRGSNFGTPMIASLDAVTAPTTYKNWYEGSFVLPEGVGPGVHNLVISVGGLTSNVGLFTVMPNIKQLSAISGIAGDVVTLGGTDFGDTTGSVTMGGVAAQVVSWSNTSVQIEVPANLGTGGQGIILIAASIASRPVNFIVSLKSAQAVSAQGAVGTEMEITASKFGQIQSLAAGGDTTCVLTDAGAKCWGGNSWGQIGDGTTSTRFSPVGVLGLGENPLSLSVYGGYACAVTSAGGAVCWGSNYNWRLGDGTDIWRTYPDDVYGLTSGVAAVSAGGTHACALTTSGGVKCWGMGYYGALGQNSRNSSRVPVDVTGLTSGVAAVAAGGEFVCALTTGGAVKCWGRNDYGQLGNNSYAEYSSVPVAVTGLTSGVAQIVSGYAHACALTAGGAVKCWGAGGEGQIGHGAYTSQYGGVFSPANVSGLTSGVTFIAAGSNHNCAVINGGGVKCWGSNGWGKLGDGTQSSSRNAPVSVLGLASGVTKVAAGSSQSCALTQANGVKCWGGNRYGELGIGKDAPDDSTSQHENLPVRVEALGHDVQKISAGGVHTCVLSHAGGLKCVGYNLSGQLGNGTNSNTFDYVGVTGMASGISDVTSGGAYTCALSVGGAATCWGANFYGQLGDGTTVSKNSPVNVFGHASGVEKIVAGSYNACSIQSSGLRCWGYNARGQLANGNFSDSSFPVAITGISSNVSDVSLGLYHICALDNGGVKCWGANDYGQLGDGTTQDRSVPTSVSGLTTGVAAVVARGHLSCALTEAGAVYCWGSNSYGQLGDGTFTSRFSPAQVVGLSSGVIGLAGSGAHMCALLSGGGVKCWGIDRYGETGTGSYQNVTVPTHVVGLRSGVAAISSSGSHTCALLEHGTVKCWGVNDRGQLGVYWVQDALAPGAVWFGGEQANVTLWGTNSVKFLVPDVPDGNYDVVLETWGVYSSPMTFTVAP